MSDTSWKSSFLCVQPSSRWGRRHYVFGLSVRLCVRPSVGARACRRLRVLPQFSAHRQHCIAKTASCGLLLYRRRDLAWSVGHNRGPRNHVLDGASLRSPISRGTLGGREPDISWTLDEFSFPLDAPNSTKHGRDATAIRAVATITVATYVDSVLWTSLDTHSVCNNLMSNFIHQQVIGKKTNKKQYTINVKMQSICWIIKQSLIYTALFTRMYTGREHKY